jgi:hypothetical protein
MTLSSPETNAIKKWDFFICHASEDKEDIARPLATQLQRDGYAVWYDEFSLRLGDSLRRAIDKGLINSRYGIVIFSPKFFEKEWPQNELDGLFGREIYEKAKVILPIWHNISKEAVAKHSPLLAERYAALTTKGLDSVLESIKIAVKDIQATEKIATNSPSDSVRWEKVANLYWLCHDLMELFRWLLTGISKEWIDVGLRQTCFHARELNISGALIDGLEKLRDESAKLSETELSEAHRQQFAREVQIHFNAIGQLTQTYQNTIGKFESGPG